MPAHNHNLLGTTTAGNEKLPSGTLAASNVDTNFYYSPTTNLVQLNSGSIQPVGGSEPHPNMQPFLVINYSIALTGIFPSRN